MRILAARMGILEVIEIIMRIGNTDTMAFQAQLEAQCRNELLADL